MSSVGFVGLGNMGGPMARRLVEAGHEVRVFDVDRARVDALVAAGASAASSVAGCARAVEFFLTSLPRPDDVEGVMIGSEGERLRSPAFCC